MTLHFMVRCSSNGATPVRAGLFTLSYVPVSTSCWRVTWGTVIPAVGPCGCVSVHVCSCVCAGRVCHSQPLPHLPFSLHSSSFAPLLHFRCVRCVQRLLCVFENSVWHVPCAPWAVCPARAGPHSPAFQAAPPVAAHLSLHPLLLSPPPALSRKSPPQTCAGGAFKRTGVHTQSHTQCVVHIPHFLSSLSSFPFFSSGLQNASVCIEKKRKGHTQSQRWNSQGRGTDGAFGGGGGASVLPAPALPSTPPPRPPSVFPPSAPSVPPSECDPGAPGSVSPARPCLCFHPNLPLPGPLTVPPLPWSH